MVICQDCLQFKSEFKFSFDHLQIHPFVIQKQVL